MATVLDSAILEARSCHPSEPLLLPLSNGNNPFSAIRPTPAAVTNRLRGTVAPSQKFLSCLCNSPGPCLCQEMFGNSRWRALLPPTQGRSSYPRSSQQEEEKNRLPRLGILSQAIEVAVITSFPLFQFLARAHITTHTCWRR